MPGVGAFGYDGTTSWGLFSPDAGATAGTLMPYDKFSADSLQRGEFPLWNPYQGLGVPFAGNPQTAIFSPFLHLQLALPRAFWDCALLFALWLSGLFMFLYLQQLGLAFGASMFGAAVWISSNWLLCFLSMRVFVDTIAALPLLLYGIEVLTTRSSKKGGLALASGVFLVLTGGQPEIAMLALLVAGAYGVFRCLDRAGLAFGKPLLRLSVFGLAGLLLAFPLITSVLDVYPYVLTSRSGLQGSQLPGVASVLSWQGFISLFSPSFFGPVHRSWASWFSWDSWQGSIEPVVWYLGILGLFYGARIRSRVKWFWALVFLVLVAKFFGVPVLNRSLGSIPGLSLIYFPRYGGGILAFGAAVLSAYGLASLSETTAEQQKKALLVLTFLVALAFALVAPGLARAAEASVNAGAPSITFPFGAGLGGAALAFSLFLLWMMWTSRRCEASWMFAILLMGAMTAISRGLSGKVWAATFGVAFLGGTTAVIWWMTRRHARWTPWALLLIVAIAQAALSVFAEHGLPERHDPFKVPPYVDFLHEESPHGERIYGLDPVMTPNTASAFGVTDVRVLEALLPRASASLISHLDPGGNPFYFGSSYWRSDGPPVKDYRENRRFFDLAGVKYVLAAGTDPFMPPGWSERAPLARSMFLLQGEVSQGFISHDEQLAGVRVLMNTGGRPMTGDIVFRLYRIGESVAVREVRIDAAAVESDKWHLFSFDPVAAVEGEPFRFTLLHSNSIPGNEMGLWRWDTAVLPNEIVSYPVSDVPIYDKEIEIYANPSAFPRVFLVSEFEWAETQEEAIAIISDPSFDLRSVAVLEKRGDAPLALTAKEASGTQVASQLIEFSQTANTVSFAIQVYGSGIAVLTDVFFPGWHAYVNGVEQQIYRVDGVFRGVYLENGVHEVEYHYAPAGFRLSVAVSLASFAGLVGWAGLPTLAHRLRRTGFWRWTGRS